MTYGSNINVNGNEVQNAVFQNLAIPPSTPKAGQMFYSTALQKIGYWNGTAWTYGATLIFQNAAPVSWSQLGDNVTLTIAPVTQTSTGLMLAADKTKLDQATATNTFNTVVLRDATGNIAVSSVATARVTGLNAPIASTDGANKAYVDSVVSGLKVKNSVRAATTTNITLTGLQTVDGVVLVAGNRVLVKNQATATQNGVWLANAAAWTRADDYVIGYAASSTFMFIDEGTINGENGWSCTNDNGSDIVGTANLVYGQFSGAGQIIAGLGMTKNGNQLDINALDETIFMGADGFRVKMDTAQFDIIAGVGIRLKTNIITAAHIQAATFDTTIVLRNGVYSVAGLTVVANATVGRIITLPGNIGGGVAVTFTHGFNTTDVGAFIKDATTNEQLIVDCASMSPNAVTVTANGVTRAVKVLVYG